ncbi:MAG: glycosyltransferase family 4 protein, partial [Magnetococcales bacterium]|nr:glycosyltransferase family 4 protein [Magnetococcales bacterium]
MPNPSPLPEPSIPPDPPASGHPGHLPAAPIPPSVPPTRLVYYSDQRLGSDHTSVESLFAKYLPRHLEVQVVYHDPENRPPGRVDAHRLVIPREQGRDDFLRQVSQVTPLTARDIVVVRNIFSVLANLLDARRRGGFRIGFHGSFPHSYRRLAETETLPFRERRLPAWATLPTRIRKYCEYRYKRRIERTLIHRCDAFLPISERLPPLMGIDPARVPIFPVPSGVDFALIPTPDATPEPTRESGGRRLLYVGTVDPLRGPEVLFRALDGLSRRDWTLDIFTRDADFTREVIANSMRHHRERVRLLPPLPRQELYQRMVSYDVGIGLIPPIPVYNVSSPIKILEYFACGLPTLMTPLPECELLFSRAGCGWFTPFTVEAVRERLGEILET